MVKRRNNRQDAIRDIVRGKSIRTQRALVDELQAIGKVQRSGSHEGGELTKRMAGCHGRLEICNAANGADNALQENCGLSYLCLAQLLIRSIEHYIGDAIT